MASQNVLLRSNEFKQGIAPRTRIVSGNTSGQFELAKRSHSFSKQRHSFGHGVPGSTKSRSSLKGTGSRKGTGNMTGETVIGITTVSSGLSMMRDLLVVERNEASIQRKEVNRLHHECGTIFSKIFKFN